jgi:ribose-phosphate pyrophosphokinase
MFDAPPCLLALDSSHALAESIAQQLGIALAALEERDFEDGEHKSRPLCELEGRDVYLVQSLAGDAHRSVDEKLIRLLFALAVLKDAGAARVSAVVPYLAYARKDRRTQPRDPVTLRYLAQLIQSMGTGCMITMDVHNLAAFENAFACRTEHLRACEPLARAMATRLSDREVVVVSPDAGGVLRAREFQQQLSAMAGRAVGLASAQKQRAAGQLSLTLHAGQLRGCTAVIVDDLIAAGGTIARTARLCLGEGAHAVHAVATHGLFVGGAATALADCGLHSLLVTDTVPGVQVRLPAAGIVRKLEVVPVASLFARAIARLHGRTINGVPPVSEA